MEAQESVQRTEHLLNELKNEIMSADFADVRGALSFTQDRSPSGFVNVPVPDPASWEPTATRVFVIVLLGICAMIGVVMFLQQPNNRPGRNAARP